MIYSLLFLCAAILLISYLCYRIAFYSPPKSRETITSPPKKIIDAHKEHLARGLAQLELRPYEEVFITSHDGLRLAAKYYHTREGAPLTIAFHGYRSSSLTDFAAGSELCFALGHNLLLVDQRGRGGSAGNTISFGILERQDCLRWTRYAADRVGRHTPIFLYGISMGATTVLMASALDLPKNVKGILADCPFSSPLDIIRAVSDRRHYPTKLLFPFLCLGARIFGHFRLTETTAAEAVTATDIPILILHGEADTFVPAAMSAEIQTAAPDHIHRETFPGASHGISILVDESRYGQIVRDFTQKALSRSENTP